MLLLYKMVAVEDGTGFILWALACSRCLNGFDDKSLVGNEISHNLYTHYCSISYLLSRMGCPSPSSYLPVLPILVILLQWLKHSTDYKFHEQCTSGIKLFTFGCLKKNYISYRPLTKRIPILNSFRYNLMCWFCLLLKRGKTYW